MTRAQLVAAFLCVVACPPASAQTRTAMNLDTHSEVTIARSAAAIWPYILDPSAWKRGAKLEHHAGPAGQVGEVLAAREAADAPVAFFIENVELVPNRRRTIKLYGPDLALIGHATWSLREAGGRTEVGYDVYSETRIDPAQTPAMSSVEIREAEATSFAANQKRFDDELLGLKKLLEAGSAPVDSFVAVVANRVVLDIKAPASLIWTFLPGLRRRPNMERVSLDGPLDQFGSRFDTIFRDSAGTVTRHDRIEVMHWEPGVRYVAHVRYLPPGEPLDIIYNVDLHESGGATRFVMDSYSTVRLPDPGTAAERVASLSTRRKEWQEAVMKGYVALKAEIEAAAKR